MNEKDYQEVMHEIKTLENEPEECEYCREPFAEDIFNNRTFSKNNDIYTGFSVEIYEDALLHICCCADTPYTKGTWSECDVKIKYCPMCGREL